MEDGVHVLVGFEHCFFALLPLLVFFDLLLRLSYGTLPKDLLQIAIVDHRCLFARHLFDQMLLIHFILYLSLDELSLSLLLILNHIIIDYFLPKLAVLLLDQVSFLVCVAERLIHCLLVNLFEAFLPLRHPCRENHIQNAVGMRVVEHLLARLSSVRDVV